MHIAPLAVQPGPGPESPPSSRPRSGLYSAAPVQYGGWKDAEFEALKAVGPSEYRAPLELDATALVTGSRLLYAIYPEDGDAEGSKFAATSVAVDLHFDDGSTLANSGQLDQHGFGATAASQGRSKSLLCDQWNMKVIDLSAFAGRRIRAAELVLASGGNTATGTEINSNTRGWIDGIHTDVAPATPLRPIQWVNTLRGTHSSALYSRGNTIPAVAVPHGFSFVTPATNARTTGWIYSYSADDVQPGIGALEAFATSHQASPWMGDRGVVQILPIDPTRAATLDPTERALRFRRQDESARPHRYDVRFECGVSAAMSATSHAAVFAFDFRAAGRNAPQAILIDQRTGAGMLEFDVKSDEVACFSGFTDGDGAEQRMFFVGRFDRPAVEASSFDGDHKDVSGIVRFDPSRGSTVTLQLGTSFISVEQAWRNLKLEVAPTDTVSTVASRADTEWSSRLDLINVDGATDDQMTTLYSSLYRMFLYPNDASENAGTTAEPRRVYANFFKGAGEEPQVQPGHIVVNNGFWDTYRTAWPALLLLDPARAGHLLDGFVEHYRASGSTPRWSAPEPKDCMVGTSSDLIFAHAAVLGVDTFDLEAAYDSALRNSTAPSDEPATGRKGLARGIFRGYIDRETEEGLSWSLENAIADYGISRFSEVMACRAGIDHPRAAEYRANAEYFARRAAAFRLTFDRDSGFFRGRGADGNFDHSSFNPAAWGGDYTETNAWGMAFTVPHDGAGLAEMYGGTTELEAKLDAFFSVPESGTDDVKGAYPVVIHEMVEARNLRMGMFGLSNQPAHHIPFMYLFARAPHKTQRIVRESLERCFTGSEIGQGYPGDEDNGEMSAWYVFSALGLYPLTLASGGYVLTSPLYRKATLKLPDSALLEIRTIGDPQRNPYIQRVRINDEEWTSTFVPHGVVARGGVIEFTLGDNPSSWGCGADAAPPSLSDHPDRPSPLFDLSATRCSVHGSVADAEIAFDDDSRTALEVDTGDWIECEIRESSSVDLYTVTADPGLAGWRLEASADGCDWQIIDRRTQEIFRWVAQTRPFLISSPSAYRYYRVIIESNDAESRIRQLELAAAPDSRV